MNENIKIEKYYNHDKLLLTIFKMEQMYMLSKNEAISSDYKKCANGLYNHFKRLAICIIMKEFPDNIGLEQILTKDNIDTMFKS